MNIRWATPTHIESLDLAGIFFFKQLLGLSLLLNFRNILLALSLNCFCNLFCVHFPNFFARKSFKEGEGVDGWEAWEGGGTWGSSLAGLASEARSRFPS